MAVATTNLAPTIFPSLVPSTLCLLRQKHHRQRRRFGEIRYAVVIFRPVKTVTTVSLRVSKRRNQCVVQATAGTGVLDNATPPPPPSSASSTPASVEIPVSCYQLIGVRDQAEKDEIVKSVMQLKNSELEDGYTLDAVVARKDLLMDVRDKLLFEPEYAGNVREKIPPKSSLRIPWPWLPVALSLLQEVGEEKKVLDIGRAALQHPDAKPYVHDLLLAMALAECAIAKIGFEKNKVSIGFEALARAQCLLRSKASLGKLALLSQIEESLEELAPACTLEILGMPHSPENAEKRRGAIAALRELLRQGLDVESSSRVQDWPCFLNLALNRLMATEIVDLLPWEDLAIIRKNKKSLESQNQRVVIDFNCFYVALMAYIALGFSSKQIQLINKAKTICECIMSAEGVDIKFEEAFCLFLLAQGTEAEAIEKLHQLELSSNPAARSIIPGKEKQDATASKLSLETWLKDSVFAVFSDTRDCSPSLANFFSGEKRAPVNKRGKVAPQGNPTLSSRPLLDTALKRLDHAEALQSVNSSQLLGSAVKQLAATDLQSSFVLGKNGNGSPSTEPAVQLKRNFFTSDRRVWESWLTHKNVLGKLTFVAVLGCIAFSMLKLSGINIRMMRKIAATEHKIDSGSLFWNGDTSHPRNIEPANIRSDGMARRMKKLLAMVRLQLGDKSDHEELSSSGVAARSRSSSFATVSRKKMSIEEAEFLVKQWQAIKAEALGPSHRIHGLSEVLNGQMLAEWQALAEAAKARSCYWRFVLLQLSVLQADITSDEFGSEIAVIEAVLEEAAELVDETQQKNPTYYSTYKIHYLLKREEEGSWRFCEGEIQTPFQLES